MMMIALPDFNQTGTDNKNRYVIATQSLALRKILRGVAGLPIVYIARSVVLLEAPSDKTLAKKKEVSHRPFLLTILKRVRHDLICTIL